MRYGDVKTSTNQNWKAMEREIRGQSSVTKTIRRNQSKKAWRPNIGNEDLSIEVWRPGSEGQKRGDEGNAGNVDD